MNIASTALTLFLVLDPFGNMVTFHSLLERVPARRRRRVLIRELLIAFAVLVFFVFAGSAILSTLGIRISTLNISGGILLFLIALGMVFPAKSILYDSDTSEPFIVPIAVPLLVGPSTIALLLLLASRFPSEKLAAMMVVSIAWGSSAAILLVSSWVLRVLGSKGTQAMERLMGLMLILIAVQMFLDGVFLGDYFHPSVALPAPAP